MNKQDAFNTVCEHLMKQGEKARDSGNTDWNNCVYRAPDGKKCAVGCLIPDDKYSDMMEGLSAWDLIGQYPWFCQEFGSMGDMLRDLQAIHDTQSVDSWPINLFITAGTYNLTLPDCVKAKLTQPA
jgi:hypothetical protein